MQLNDSQEKAVETTEGAVLVIAGAGSGKTRVLTERLARIIETGMASPEETLTVTFTNKAAAEIKQRALARLNSGSGRGVVYNIPWMGTFHSIAVRMLRKEAHHLGLSNYFTIYDADDQLSLVKTALKNLNISTNTLNPRKALGAISSAKHELILPKDYALNAAGYFEEKIATVYQQYQKLLETNQAMDFDDLLINVVRVLQVDERVAEKYQNMFKYIMVDEYQDTNHVQYLIVKNLSQKHGNIFVVGDDDQSIYSWRGANIRNILEFEKDFQDATIIKLEQNYRSTKKILDASHGVVTGIGQRKGKKLWTENPEGESVYLYNALDEYDEVYWLAERVARLIETDQINPEEIAVLYRMNSQSRLIEEAFLKAGIPYRIVGNVRFYERKEIKDTLSYLRIIFNPADDISLLRIINVPSRKIGAKTIDRLLEFARMSNTPTGEYMLTQKASLDQISKGLADFARVYESIKEFAQENNVVELIKYILEKSGYLEMLNDGSEESKSRVENLKELINVAGKYAELSPEASLQAFLEEVALVENQAEEKGNSAEDKRVTLMTVHAAKGLEYKHVFILGMEEGVFPHTRSIDDPTQLDEERRLAYVAITRAKDRVYMSYANTRRVYGTATGTTPSRFLSDINPELIDFESYSTNYGGTTYNAKKYVGNSFGHSNKTDWDDAGTPAFQVNPGDRVQHEHFGKGRVMAIDEDYVIVQFDDAGKKELATEYANLIKV
jgi:DNA helicase-2/ATP-dependent DNA helicase PcrA